MRLTAEDRVSPAEYLRKERLAELKSEYYNGRVDTMAGASPAHCLIAANLIIAIGSRLQGSPCRVYTGDLRVKVEREGLYTYPDAVVLCGEPRFEDAAGDTLTNPTLLVEVLSPSTERYDRGDKFAFYRGIDSLREILFVAQDQPRVERYTRREGRWELTEFKGTDAQMELETVPGPIPLSAVYDGVQFSGRNALQTRPG